MANTITLKDSPITIGTNILAAQAEDGKLILIIDPAQDLGPSGSGKTIMIATTRGNVSVGKAKIGINMYKYPDNGR